MPKNNPTDTIDVSFDAYVKKRKAGTEAHLEGGGIPDYAYGNDYVLRQKIKALPGFYPLAKALTNTVVPREKQKLNLEALKVGPNQFPDVYAQVVDCARILGIGIPTTYIKPDKEINAFAYCTEDDAPLIVITSGLMERVTPGELKTVIGHECGHVHNNHVIFNLAAEIIINLSTNLIPGVKQIANLVTAPLQLALKAWSRAAETTCDRAGVICADDVNDAITMETKFLYGAALNRSDANLEAILKQYDSMRATPVRLLELGSTHPTPVRRIFGMKEFMNSEVLYKWRPEWKTPGMKLYTKQELDARCEKFLGVVKSEKRRPT